MNEKAIQQARQRYNDIKTENDTLLSYKDELLKLSETKDVKRFLELSRLVAMDYSGLSEEIIARNAYENIPSVKNIDSNQIMVYMGSYITNNLGENKAAAITYERDPNTSYKSYMDLETTETYNIDKEKCSDFELESLALYLPISEYSKEEYYKKYCELQDWFKAQLLHRSQPNVIEELQKKYSKEKVLCSSFHKIDTITGLPIDEYIKAHPEDGFVENFSLSREEYMRVKLYRKQLNENPRKC